MITRVVDTHLHADHLSGGRELVAASGATLHLPAPTFERGLAYEVDPLADGDLLTSAAPRFGCWLCRATPPT